VKRLSALHHISIIESRGTNCAWVRIKYDSKSFQQSFPFKKYGGKTKAIAAAKKKRDIEGKKIYGPKAQIRTKNRKREREREREKKKGKRKDQS
jgi:hypothetical protein